MPLDPHDHGATSEARQYSGRIVTVTNAKIFDEPVYNYTRDFPYLWEELRLPIPYSADRARARAAYRDRNVPLFPHPDFPAPRSTKRVWQSSVARIDYLLF